MNARALRLVATALVSQLLAVPANCFLAGSGQFSALRHELHDITPTESGHRATNPEQDWLTAFEDHGFVTRPRTAAWEWGLTLASVGNGDVQLPHDQPECSFSESGRLTQRWSDWLEEWYVNDERGLEHGYTVYRRPSFLERTGLLQLNLKVRGGLVPRVSEDARDVEFVDRNGVTRVHYSGLLVLDRDEHELAASFFWNGEELELYIEDAAANYPLLIDPVAQQATLEASNAGVDDWFGLRMDISGDTLVIAASREDSSASGVNGVESNDDLENSGAAYVFVRSGSDWLQQAYLKASNPEALDFFAIDVAISGDTIVIGASGEDSSASGVNGDDSDNSSLSSGAAYVFARTGTVWTQQAYLKASNTDAGDGFGLSVGVSGDTIVVGSPREDGAASGINGNEASNSLADSGAAYVFVRSGSVWSQEAYIKSAFPDVEDNFGYSVDISGDTVAIGAHLEDGGAPGVNGNQTDNALFAAGAAYVFRRTGSSWSQEAYLKAPNPDPGDRFGEVLAIHEETIVVAATDEDSCTTGVNGDGSSNALFQSGAAYVFARTGLTWNQQAYLKASNPGLADEFGTSVAISGDRILVGAFGEDGGGTSITGAGQAHNGAVGVGSADSGAVYSFLRTGSHWKQLSYLKAPSPQFADQLGRGCAVEGDTGVAGALFRDTGMANSGAAFVFDLAPTLPPSTIEPALCLGSGGNQLECTDCPCGNNAYRGVIGGCLNSSAKSARLFASGDTSVSLPPNADTDLRFEAIGLPPEAAGVLVSGDFVASVNPMNPCFGLQSGVRFSGYDGLRCAVMNFRRHGIRAASTNGDLGGSGTAWGGESNPPAGMANAGMGFGSGQKRFFQVIYRDLVAQSCMTGLNTSQAVGVTFTP